jgi:signal transduction histidine kinase
MTDIVWAIDPERDHGSDLAQRMRQFASDICTAACVAFEFTVQNGIEKCVVHSDVRRELLLLFKECVHNACDTRAVPGSAQRSHSMAECCF